LWTELPALDFLALLLPKKAPSDEAKGLSLILQDIGMISIVDDHPDVGGYGGSVEWDKLKEKLRNHSFFKALRQTQFRVPKKFSLDVEPLFAILDKDECIDESSVSEETLAALMKAPLFHGTARPKSLPRVFFYLDWPSLFALIGALNDDKFGRDGWSPNPSRRDATLSAAKYLRDQRHNIEVRLVAVRACLCRQSRGAPVDAACCLALVFLSMCRLWLQNFLAGVVVPPRDDNIPRQFDVDDDGCSVQDGREDVIMVESAHTGVTLPASGHEQVVAFRAAMGRIAGRL